MPLQKLLSLLVMASLLLHWISIGHLRALVDPLRFLLAMPEEEEKKGKPVTVFYKSFPDFFTDKPHSVRDYWINSSVYIYSASHMDLCLNLLSNSELLIYCKMTP